MGSFGSAAQATAELFEMPTSKVSGENQVAMPEPRGMRAIEKAHHKYDLPASVSRPA
jgi:hypothetical protein